MVLFQRNLSQILLRFPLSMVSVILLFPISKETCRDLFSIPTWQLLFWELFSIFSVQLILLFSSSYLSIHFERDIVKIADSASIRRVKAVSNKISALLKEKIPDENDRILLTGLLLLCTISDKSSPDTLAYPETVTELAERYGLKL